MKYFLLFVFFNLLKTLLVYMLTEPVAATAKDKYVEGKLKLLFWHQKQNQSGDRLF